MDSFFSEIRSESGFGALHGKSLLNDRFFNLGFQAPGKGYESVGQKKHRLIGKGFFKGCF